VKAELVRLSAEKNGLMDDRQYIETAINLLKDGGIKTKIIKQYLPIINKQINKYLSQMGFFVNFNINESFEETIKSRYRDEFQYANFSEGEKMRIDLALLFTWRSIAKMRNSVNTNLLILDEVLDGSLDGNGTDEFLKIMWSMIGDTNTFVISHKQDQLFDKFQKVLKFQKIKNFSQLAA
jgi:DNA repair exonuclease SbcCD ATPase subunit